MGGDLAVAALGLAAGLDHHHRLGARRRTRGRHELARITDLIDVQQDGAGAVIGGEVIQQVAEIHVQRIAQRYHCGEADRTCHAPLHQRRGNRTGFGDQRDIAGLRGVCGDAGIEPRMWGDHAKAVRAQHAHALGACGRFHLRGQRTGALAQPGGEDDGPRHAQLGGLAHHLRQDAGRHRDHHQVRNPRQVLEPLDRAHAVDLGVARADPADLPGKAAGAQVADHRAAGRAITRAAAHHGHRTRAEYGLQVIGTHCDACCG